MVPISLRQIKNRIPLDLARIQATNEPLHVGSEHCWVLQCGARYGQAKKSRTVRPAAGVESPPPRRLPLVELLIDTEAELFELAVRSALQVFDVMLEDDRAAICGPWYAHQADRTAARAGGQCGPRRPQGGDPANRPQPADARPGTLPDRGKCSP